MMSWDLYFRKITDYRRKNVVGGKTEMRTSSRAIAMMQARDKGGLNRGSGSRRLEKRTDLRDTQEVELTNFGVC